MINSKSLNKGKSKKILSSIDYFAKTNETWLLVCKHILYGLLFYLFYNVSIMKMFSPCFFGFFLALIFLKENIFIISFTYFLATALNNASGYSLLFAIICALLGGMGNFLNKKLKRVNPILTNCFYSLLIGLVYIYLNFSNISQLYISVINVLFNILFMIICFNFFNIMKARHFSLNLNIDEIACGSFILALIFCGLENINLLQFDLVKFVGLLLVIFSSKLLPNTFGVILGLVSGIGSYLGNGELQYFTFFAIVSLFCCIFKNQHKIYMSLSVIVVDICLGFFLGLFVNYNIFSFIPTLLVAVIYLFIPSRLINKISQNIYTTKENDTLKNLLNYNKLAISKKLLYTAEIFYEMDKSFRKLVQGKIDIKTAKTMLCSETIRLNCQKCPNRATCLAGSNNELKRILQKLISAGFEKGKITLVDLPPYLTSRCIKLNQLIMSINKLLEEYKGYIKSTSDLDNSKLLIAEQLKGVSSVLANLSVVANEKVNLDHRFESQIKEALIYNDIIPIEIVCFEQNEQTSIVSMTVRSVDFDNDRIIKILNSVCPSKMVLSNINHDINSSQTYASYKTAFNYDMAVGISQTTKGGSEKSGDTYSIIKLDDGKMIYTICDGMGSGKKASKQSEISINLIENFYKAGYDSETVLSCVNKLLNLTSEEVFSAVDISVVDLKNGEVDFIKQGATVGFIKRGQEIIKIESNSLPMGILKDIAPKITKTMLTTEDFIIMLSDGVVDAFGEDSFIEFLKTLQNKSPQELSNNILNKAKTIQKNYTDDDMTILVGKMFYNYI